MRFQKTVKNKWQKKFNNKSKIEQLIIRSNLLGGDLRVTNFGGGNTFLESMIVGTPTITLPGNYLKSNITAAAYKQMKIKHPPIAKNSEEFVSLATELAKDAKKNHGLRSEHDKRRKHTASEPSKYKAPALKEDV